MRSFLYEESEQENILLTWFILKRIVWLLLFIRLFKVNISLGYIFILKYQGNCGQNLFKFSFLSLWLRVMRVGIESTVNVDNMSRHFFFLFLFFDTIPQVIINCSSGNTNYPLLKLSLNCVRKSLNKPGNNRKLLPVRSMEAGSWSWLLTVYKFMPKKYVNDFYFPKESIIHWWQSIFSHFIFSQTWAVFVLFFTLPMLEEYRFYILTVDCINRFLTYKTLWMMTLSFI